MSEPTDHPRDGRSNSRRRGSGRRTELRPTAVTERNVVRILLVGMGAVIYLPAAVLATIQIAGPADLQALFDWMTGRCAANCSDREIIATAIQIAPIVLTVPVLAWLAIIWVIRGGRADRQVTAIDRHFATAPDRVSPHAIEAEEERYLYRDRQGRLRPVYSPPTPKLDK